MEKSRSESREWRVGEGTRGFGCGVEGRPSVGRNRRVILK
jgi:hypothetical protein